MTAWISPLNLETRDQELQKIYEHLQAATGSVTNMKRTLARSPVALRIYMEWYSLKKECSFLDEKTIILFCYAISRSYSCPVCSTYFIRAMKKADIDIGELDLLGNENWRQNHYPPAQHAVISFALAFAENRGMVADSIMKTLKQHFSELQIVNLTAFAGMMVATNLFNNALQVEVEE